MPFVGDTLYIDNSTLTKVYECDFAAVLRYWHDLTSRQEKATLKSGSAGHIALETFFRGGTVEEAMAAFDESYMEWAEKHVPASDRLSYENVGTIVQTYLRDIDHEDAFPAFEIDPELVEIGFAQPLCDDPPIVITGKLDLVVRDDDLYFPLDHKFTGRLDNWWARKFEMGSQGMTYVWATKQQLGYDVGGFYINAIELKKLPASSKFCDEHKKTYEDCGHQHFKSQIFGPFMYTDKQIEEWERTAKTLAIRFWDLCEAYPELKDLQRLELMGPFVYQTCMNCDFNTFCKMGRPIKHVKSMLVKEQWSPIDVSQFIKKVEKK